MIPIISPWLPIITLNDFEVDEPHSFLIDIFALKLEEVFSRLSRYKGKDKDFLLGLYYEQTLEYVKAEEHLYSFCLQTEQEAALAHLAFVKGRLGRSGKSQEFSHAYQMQLKFWTAEITVADKLFYSSLPELNPLYKWMVLLQYLRDRLCPMRLLTPLLDMPRPCRPILIEIVERLACKTTTPETHSFMESLIPLSHDVTLGKLLARYFLFQKDAKNVGYILNFLVHLNDEETLSIIGRYYELVGDDHRSMACYIVIPDPTTEETYIRKLIALEQARSPHYFTEIRKAREKFPSDLTIQCMEAGMVAESDKSRAKIMLHKILRKDPEFYVARRLLLNLMNDYRGLYKLFSEQLKREPNHTQMRVLRVDVALKLKEHLDTALVDCEILSRDMPKSLPFEKAYLEVLFLSRSYKKAISRASTILQSEPLNARAYYIKAYSHFRLGEVDQALSFFEAFESIGALTADEAFFKGEVLALEGKWEEALVYFKEINPSHREQVKTYLTCLMNTQRESEAVKFFQRMELAEQAMLGELGFKIREMRDKTKKT